MLGRILDGMKPFFGTTSDVAMLSCAGSGGLEAAVVNTLSPGDRVLGVSIGAFGDRFAKIAGDLRRGRHQARRRVGLRGGRPTRSASALRTMPDAKAVLLTHNETSTGVMNPIADLAAADPRRGARGAHPRRQRVGPRRGPVRDGRLGRRRRRHRLAEGVDGGAGPRDGRGVASGRGPRWRPRRCRASTSTCGPTASPRPPARRRSRPRSRVVYQVDEGLRLMQAEGKDGGLRPPRGLRRRGAGRPGGPRLRAVRRPALRLEDRHRGEPPRRPRLEGVQRRDQAPRRRPRRRPGQADRQDLPARPSRVGDGRRDPRGHRRPRAGRPRAGPPGRARSRRSRRPQAAAARRPARLGERAGRGRARRVPPCPREGPRRRAHRARRASSASRAVHEVDERPGISRDELCAILPDYDALVVRSQVAGRRRADRRAGNRLQVIGRAGVGVDNVDLDAATAAGITVVNAPTGNTIAAAEHTLALLYGVARRVAAADASVRRGEWKRAAVHGPRAARPDARDRRARQDRPGDRGTRPSRWR